MNLNRVYRFLSWGVLSWCAIAPAAESSIDFSRDIAPIFEQHCVRCHAPGNRKGDLSLTTADDLTANAYLIAGAPDASYLVELITAADGVPPQMPKEGEPLRPEQVELIRRWIAEGAVWPREVQLRTELEIDRNWWSLQPLSVSSQAASTARNGEWTAQASVPIDSYILSKLRERGLSLNSPADPRTLIRRATYDLTGLPPTPEQVEAFVSDPDPRAYERLIDRLLASPHYGERWGRHWLDVVRFGESRGFERNEIINNLWPFRDYVIRSFNEDKPMDQLIREHLAGDLLAGGNPEIEVGSSFLVAGPYDDVGNQDAEQAAQIRADTIDEMIRATSEAFLGLTIGCARCHNHKFDPILQRDYYAWYATFAGVRHGSRILAAPEDRAAHEAQVAPLERRREELSGRRQELLDIVMQRAQAHLEVHEKHWTRKPVNRQGTEEVFSPVEARFVRLVSAGQDTNPANTGNFGIDEFEVWSADAEPRNVALAANGAKACGSSRTIEDFPDAYGPYKAIDGKTGERFLATGGRLTIELPEVTRIGRVFFSSARGESNPDHDIFVFVGDYRIEVSLDGANWAEVAHSRDRRPASEAQRNHRLLQLEMTPAEQEQLAKLDAERTDVEEELAAIPPLPTVWVGTHAPEDARGPFHVFLGGSPQRLGEGVVPASLDAVSAPQYALAAGTGEGERRHALADWIVHPENPLTARVMANRIWHYHFGTGLVDTPSDFGAMGGRPSHPELLDWLAIQLLQHEWRLKPLHKLLMMSRTYRQSSEFRPDAARVDADARLLWRMPPRRLSAEEIRDTMLFVSAKLQVDDDQPLVPDSGPGFRLYRYLQDNVATYVPLDEHGAQTYRRAVYHQNARATVVDLLTEFDQPDCAFATPRRAETITPLQALTMLNHRFTVDMAGFLAERLTRECGAADRQAQIRRVYEFCFSRRPTSDEIIACEQLVERHDLAALCRVLLNTSEMVYVH